MRLLTLLFFIPSIVLAFGDMSQPGVGPGVAVTASSLTTSDDVIVGDQLIVKGTATIQGAGFSVGGSTLVVTGGKVGIGTTNPGSFLEVSTITPRGTILLGVSNGTLGSTLKVKSIGTVAGDYPVNSETAGSGYNGILNIGASASGEGAVSIVTRGGAIFGKGGDTANPFVSFLPATFVGSTTVLGTGYFAGNVGIGTVSPASKLHMSSGTLTVDGTSASVDLPKIKLSAEGGYLVKMVNNAGATVSSGTVVNSTSTSVDYGFKVNPAGGAYPIGIVYGPTTTGAMGSCADAAECWVCVSGLCMAQYDSGSCVRGYWAGTSDTISGLINCSVEPIPTAKHDQEVGHNVITGASGMAWINVHMR